MPAIQTRAVTFRYRAGHPATDINDMYAPAGAATGAVTPIGDPALSEVSVRIDDGEFVVLCGRSGCGKTTFTRLLNGLVPSFHAGDLTGSCTAYGLECGHAAMERYAALVGSVFQNPKTQYFNAFVADELAFPCENAGWEPARIRERVAEVADRFGITHLLDRGIFNLSGGEKQRIAVASACMLRPRLLVLDEPTSNLDRHAMRDLAAMLADVKRMGVTIVVAEHRLAWCAGLADRYVLFDSGRVAGDFTAGQFAAIPGSRREAMGLRALDITPFTRRVDDLAARWPHRVDDETQDGATHTDTTHADKAPLLSTRGLVVGHHDTAGRFPFRRKASRQRGFGLAVPDLELFAGEIVGVMGHNGIGKTTLARTLVGLDRPLSGAVLRRGEPAKPRTLTRRGFLVMQDVNYQLFADSVRGELTLGIAGRSIDEGRPMGISAQNIVDVAESGGKTADGAACDAVLDELDLTDVADRHPMSLSGGQKQRTAIASALMCGKELIVLDEPTSGLDRRHMTQVGALLRRLADRGKAVLVITHDEELAARWCDRILDLGRCSAKRPCPTNERTVKHHDGTTHHTCV